MLSGGYEEKIGTRDFERKPTALVYYPPDVSHAEKHLSSGRHFLVEIDFVGLNRIREYGVRLDEPVILAGESCSRLAVTMYEEFRRRDEFFDACFGKHHNRIKSCAESWEKQGVDVSAYNTVENANDIDDLRKALGAEKVSLWGISYGTHLALATIRQHGRYIDRAILAGVEGTDNTLKLPNDTQKLLVEFDRRARASVELSKTIPDLLGLMKSVHERLEKQPEIVELVDPKTQSKISITVGIFDLQFIVSGLLGSNEAQAWLPNFYDAMSKGDFSFLAQQTAQYRKSGTPSLMSVAMDCASGISKERFTQIQLEKQSAMNADAINAPFPEICKAINHAELGEDFRRPVKSGVPVLFISGTLDGRTPVSNAEFVMNGFNNSSHLIIDGAGHSDPLFLSSPKIEEAMTDFMRGKKLPSVINIETSLPFRFQLPAGKTSK